jgi:hypothetical protein
VGVAYISYVGDILIAVIGGVATLVTLGVMSSLAGPAHVTVTRRVAAPASVFDQGAPPAPPVKSWTPQAVPRSLQQSPGSVAAGVVAQQQAADARRRAMAEQAYLAAMTNTPRAEPVEALTRDARAEPTGPRAEPVEAASQGASKFARLGIVDDADTASFDLDSALKRRRVG